MCIFNKLQGPLPASWFGRTRCIISVKLKLIRRVVTPVESHMLTDGRTNDTRHTIIRPTFVGRIKKVLSIFFKTNQHVKNLQCKMNYSNWKKNKKTLESLKLFVYSNHLSITHKCPSVAIAKATISVPSHSCDVTATHLKMALFRSCTSGTYPRCEIFKWVAVTWFTERPQG